MDSVTGRMQDSESEMKPIYKKIYIYIKKKKVKGKVV